MKLTHSGYILSNNNKKSEFSMANMPCISHRIYCE